MAIRTILRYPDKRLRIKAEAVSDFNAALNVDNKNADGWAGLGLAYERKGDRGQASENYNRALVLEPNNALAKAGKGRTGRV